VDAMTNTEIILTVVIVVALFALKAWIINRFM
jgi:hypothetical protein